MRIYLDDTVYEAGLKRMRWIFTNYETVVVSHSGGKDSTVLFWLALIVAKEMNRLPLSVMFLDQEAEYGATIDIIKSVMEMPEVKPHWYQVPFKLFNANSIESDWLYCWDEKEKDNWIHPQMDYAIKENTYGQDRFKDLFEAIELQDFPRGSAFLVGMRTEESPARLMALTGHEVDKGVTWGKKVGNKKKKGNVPSYVFYPLYDWSYTDIWKAILDNNWPYCEIYNKQFSAGVSIHNMRVSSLCHEVSSQNLQFLHEFEKDTWQKVTKRVGGSATSGTFGSALLCPKQLPFMFTDWVEYRDYLAEKLLHDEGKDKIKKAFLRMDKSYVEEIPYLKTCVNTILSNDHYLTKLDMFKVRKNLDQRGKK